MSINESPLHGRLVFVVGVQRSGTNWLERVLATHPDIAVMPSETHLLSHGISPLTQLLHHANPGSQMVTRTYVDRATFTRAARAFLDQIFLDNLERLDGTARYLVERTPAHARHLDLIAQIFPDSRVIHIVRDGRAVARSLVAMEWGPQTVAAAAHEWRQTVVKARTDGRPLGARYREVHYEALLSDPRRQIEELFEWLEMRVPDKLWADILSAAKSPVNVDPSSPAVAVDKWRRELSPRDVRTFERIAGDELQAFGYARVGRVSRRDMIVHRVKDRGNTHRRKYLAKHIRPHTAIRAALGETLARQSARAVADQHRVMELFERMVADGRTDDAFAIFSTHRRIRLVDGDERLEGRGDAVAHRLLQALSDHYMLGLRPRWGDVHVGKRMMTSLLAYDLEDGSMWIRTLVFNIVYPQIVSLAMYRARVVRHE